MAKGKFKLVTDIGGVVTGIISLAKSAKIAGMESGGVEFEKSYGGDAYTGIQNAAAQAANNSFQTNTILREGFAALLLVIGIALICVFLGLLIKDLAENKNTHNDSTPLAIMPQTPTETIDTTKHNDSFQNVQTQTQMTASESVQTPQEPTVSE